MKIYVFGAWETGLDVVKKIKDNYGGDIEGFIDSKKSGSFSEYTIFDPVNIPRDSAIVFAHDNIIIAADMYNSIRDLGFENLYWFMNLSDSIDYRTDFLIDECFRINNWGSCVLPNMELHISDMCNLNCRNCTHFSPLYDEIGVDFERCIADVRILRSKFTNIGRLDVLGGEPLLSPDLDKYIIALKKLLPDTYLNIFTNGILIPSLSDEVLDVIRENKITVTISEYPPVKKMLNVIVTRLISKGIRYRITSFRGDFNIPISVNHNTKHPLKCISDGCICVSDGKLSRCPTLMYVHRFNEVFGTDLPEEGILSLDNCPGGDELLKLLKKDVPLCKYCIECGVEWSVCGKEKRLEDFAVRD